jgi:mono/diheme cytochrome c family protein
VVMPTGFYGIITEPDMDAIVAYLRTLKPIANRVPTPEYRIALQRQVFPGAEKPWSSPGTDAVSRGFYLASLGHCMECHTPLGPQGREFATKLGTGGAEFPGPWGKSVSRNITSDPDHGIGKWSDAEIRRAITQGISRDGTPLKPPMGFGFYAKMASADVDDVIAYLRTVKPAN